MPKNVSTKKEYTHVASPLADKAYTPRSATAPNERAENAGQMRGKEQPFADPMNEINAAIGGFGRTYDDIGEKSGFITDGYLDKGGTPYGEAAKFNFLPPGMDISNQENAEINVMKLYKITEESYPGDGWMPKPIDMPE